MLFGVLCSMPEIGVPFHDDRNSMLYWYPKIKDLGIPMPETEFFLLSEEEIDSPMETDWTPMSILSILQDIPTTEIQERVQSLPTQTAHIRGDYKASRLMGGEGREITMEPQRIDYEVLELLDSLMMTRFPTRAIAVREWLDLKTYGESYMSSICSEVRFIVDEGEVLGGFVDVYEDDFDRSFSEQDTQEILNDIESSLEADREQLVEWAEGAGKALGDSWSVDFIQDVEDNWYLTDMALYGLWYDVEEERWKNISAIPEWKSYNLEENPPEDLPDEPTEDMVVGDRKKYGYDP